MIMKYLILEKDIYEHLIVFTPSIYHSEELKRHYGFIIKSAGSFEIKNGILNLTHGSNSIGIPENEFQKVNDEKLISIYFGIY